MATVDIVVLKHHEKTDGTFNVKIRISHQNRHKYISTDFFVTQKALDKRYNVKDINVLNSVLPDVINYRKKIGEIKNIKFLDIGQLCRLLENGDGEPIDFIKFSRGAIKKMMENGETSNAFAHQTVINFIVDFFGRETVYIDEINYKMLVDFRDFLNKIRSFQRNKITYSSKVTNVASIFNYMSKLRTMFNRCRDFYNDEDAGIFRVKHYPFRKFKVAQPPITAKRNLSVETIRKIRDCEPNTITGRFARNMFMLSFYLCGMNSVDFLALEKMPKDRLEYSRSKTKGKRRDGAFISIKLVEEARPLLDMYLRDKRYSSLSSQNNAINKGLKEVAKMIGIDPFTFYYARHSFATIARNNCRISKYDIAMALNHVDDGFNVTDTYLEKDWTIIDDVQAKVVELLGQCKP